jgi:hypothetical protein
LLQSIFNPYFRQILDYFPVSAQNAQMGKKRPPATTGGGINEVIKGTMVVPETDARTAVILPAWRS